MKKLFTLLMAAFTLLLTGCSLIDFDGPNEQEEWGDESSDSEIPEKPLTSGPATVAITRATATTAHFEGSITNNEIDLNFVQITLRYSEPEKFSAMSEDIPSEIVTRPGFDDQNKFTIHLNELKHNTTYKFCVIVQYKNEFFYSEVQEFKTAGAGVALKVKEGSITDNSVEIMGKVGGISPEDDGAFEFGLFYSNDKSLVENGKGEKVVFDNIDGDGLVSVILSGLYMDGPKYYFRSYVAQDDNYTLGTMGSFELIWEEQRLIKKITRHESVSGKEITWVYDFEYDNSNKLIASKFSEIEDEYTNETRFTYDYSTKGVVAINEKHYYDGEFDSEEELNFNMILADNGNIAGFKFTMNDTTPEGDIVFTYNAQASYTPEGFLNEWSVSGDGEWTLKYDYSDGYLKSISYWDAEWDEWDCFDTHNSFASVHKLKSTNFDLNKVLIPYIYPSEYVSQFGAIKMGRLGDYYFGRMTVESCYYKDMPRYDRDATSDPHFKDTRTYKYDIYVDFDEDFGTIPLTTTNFDKDGYPTEFVADVFIQEVEERITYAAGELLYEEYDGVSYYEIIEVNREVVNIGAVTSAGRASITVEYCK